MVLTCHGRLAQAYAVLAKKVFLLRVQKASMGPGHLFSAPADQVAESCERERDRSVRGGVSGDENQRKVRRWYDVKGQAGSPWRKRTVRVGGKLCIALQEGVIRTSRTERVEAHSWLAGRR